MPHQSDSSPSSSLPTPRIKTRRMPSSTAKPCHNCRRRRLRCDRSWPTCHKCAVSGQTCLGYGKVFVWTQGIDANGNLRPSPPGRRALDAAKDQGTVHASSLSPPSSQTPITSPAAQHGASAPVRPQGPLPSSVRPSTPAASAVLVDPMFQDLDKNSRYYLAYCEFRTFPCS